ncbi:MAG: hypothetical protein WAN76_19785 [Candidatus Sulfotelmatobacter sp.]
MIPFIETLIEPWLRKRHPKVDAWFVNRGNALKKNLGAIALICLFIGCYRAWVFEHNNAETAMYGKDGKSEAWAKYNECDKERAVKTVLADTYSGSIATQQAQLFQQQDTFNRCVLSLGQNAQPGALKVRFRRWAIPQITQKDADGAPMKLWILLAFPNKTVFPLKGIVSCATPIHLIETTIITDGAAMRSYSTPLGDRTIKLDYMQPPWSQESPLALAVTARDDTPPDVCSFQLE